MGRPRKPDTYVKSRHSILNEVLGFPTIRAKDWREMVLPPIGSLVSMSCAPDSEWYLSWVVEVEENENGFHRVCLKSIETQKLCWWGNVSIYVFNPDRVKLNPQWMWSDKEYDFNRRWNKLCYGEHDAYILRPNRAEFNEAGGVNLSLRYRFGEDYNHEETFSDWRKVTKKMMSEFYLSGVDKHNNKKPKNTG